MTLIDLCRTLISIDSSPSAGSEDFSKKLLSIIESLGLYVDIQEEYIEGRSEFNLVVSPTPLNQTESNLRPHILLVNHLDCSEPGPLALWTKHRGNPFDLIIEDQKLHGLGIAENKADIAAKLLALSRFSKQELKHTPVFLGVFGHQSGMRGLQRWLKKNTLPIRHALIGEPTQLRPIYAVNGYARVDISVPYSSDESNLRQQNQLKDVAATSTRLFKGLPKSGVDFDSSMDLLKQVFQYFDQLPSNAALMDFDGGTQFNVQPHQILTEVDVTSKLFDPMIKKITSLYSNFTELHNQMKHNSHAGFQPASLTFNIGLIRSNINEITLSGIVRIPPHLTTQEILEWEQKARNICLSLGARMQLTDFKPSYQLTSDSQLKPLFYNRLQTLGFNPEESSLYMSNEACLLGRKQIECVIFGPGESLNNLHSPSEHVLIEDIEKARQFYEFWIQEENA